MSHPQTYPPPRLIFWETTAGCNLRCAHCRRITIADQLTPQDLTTEESYDLIDQITAFSKPILILSGGEPLIRDDIFPIAYYAHQSGLIVALATNGTLIDDQIAQKINAAGIRRVSVSFDGADSSTHDVFRGAGAFQAAMRGIKALQRSEVPFQINTTIARHNVHQVQQMLDLSLSMGAKALHLFLLVPVGCGAEISEDQQVTPQEYESVLNWMYVAEQEYDIELKATCAPHYFRIVHQQQAEKRRLGLINNPSPSQHRQQRHGARRGDGHPGGRHPLNTMTKGCLAGTGVCFISHRGEVFPCGYLPVEAGNIRKQSLQEIWEGSQVFEQLRDPDLLEGKCGICNFKGVCGGCRARAYGVSGNMLAEEPFCAYQPQSVSEQ